MGLPGPSVGWSVQRGSVKGALQVSILTQWRETRKGGEAIHPPLKSRGFLALACNEILAHAEPDPAVAALGDAIPQLAAPWWRSMVERWWFHSMAGVVSDRH